jgi:hypothetical protein
LIVKAFLEQAFCKNNGLFLTWFLGLNLAIERSSEVSMNTQSLVKLLLGVVFLIGFTANAQESIVRIPLKTLTKPAHDLIGPNGQRLTIGQLKTQFDRKLDLSMFNPIENKFWQNQDSAQYPAIDSMAIAQMPTPEVGLIYNGFVGVVRELGMYAISVKSASDPTQTYRLKSGLQVHSSLLKAALLRKIGIYQESPKYYQSVKVQFKSLAEMNEFIKQAFCVGGPDEVAISCLSIDPDDRGFISSKNENALTLMLHGSYIEKLNAEVPVLYDGLTPSNDNTLSVYAQSRAYRSLIAPYVIADVGESVNRYSAQSVSVRGGWAHLNFAFSSDFNHITSYDDVRWILRQMGKLNDRDWSEIVDAASFPQQVAPLVKAKLLHRYKDMVEAFFDRNEQKEVLKVNIPKLDYNSSDKVVVSGKVMKEKIPGFPQRFSHGERQSPFESGDFAKYLKIKGQSLAIETALSRFSEKLQSARVLNQNIVGIEVGPQGIRPLVNAEVVTFGVNAAANRIITTGTYYGSQAAVQMVDSVTIAASVGYIHIMDGLNGIDTSFGGGAAYVRNFTHVSPISSMAEATRVPLTHIYVPSRLDKLTKPLKDGKLTEFLNALKVGEVFTITDSIGLSAQIGYNTALDALIGFSSYGLTVGIAADGNKIIMRQIQFVRTNEGLQIYVRNQNNKAYGLEFNVNYFINLFKLRAQTTHRDIKTKVYVVNYDAALVGQVDNGDIMPDDDLQSRVNKMKDFGNKAALALRGLLTESSTDALDRGLRFQRFEIEHQLKANEIKTKFLWYRSSRLNEEHLLSMKKTEVPSVVNGLSVVNEPIQIVTYKRGRLKGDDLFGFGLEVADAVIQEQLQKDAPAPLRQDSINPSQMPFGKSEWTTVRTDTELTQKRPGALPTVAVVESVWGGWSLKRKDLNEIIKNVKDKTKGINFASFSLLPTGALANVDRIDFYRITSHLSILPDGIGRIKNLMMTSELPNTPEKERNFVVNFFQDLDGGAKRREDKEIFNNIIKIIGNGDLAQGNKIYNEQCKKNQASRAHLPPGHRGPPPTTKRSFAGTSYECLSDWLEKLIKLSRDYPKNDLRAQNKWLTVVIYVMDEYIPLGSILNYLGQDKFIYYLEVTGFRTGDEDGDEGVYVSNVFGEPQTKHPYANGLISVIADKSKVSVTELEQTAGGF